MGCTNIPEFETDQCTYGVDTARQLTRSPVNYGGSALLGPIREEMTTAQLVDTTVRVAVSHCGEG